MTNALTGFVIRKNEYHDSVFLMRTARTISEQEGVVDAAAFMGTEKNKTLLADMGFGDVEISDAASSDLIIAVKADSRLVLDEVFENTEQWLVSETKLSRELNPRTLNEAAARQPRANLAVISVPGEYAAREAKQALENGLNVFLFSDNVSVENELDLKKNAREKGLIVMGPDCGTAIIGGIGIGFANAVRRGPIGVIGASGTGIQEFTTLVHQSGSGISQAIGTGGRDLSDEIGGLSTLSALSALESDSETKVIGILAKPPGSTSLCRLGARINACPKPVVTCILGTEEDLHETISQAHHARTLEEAAFLAVQVAAGNSKPSYEPALSEFEQFVQEDRSRLKQEQKYIRGLFAGGTFCYQAQQVLRESGIKTFSNAPTLGNQALPDSFHSTAHSLVDMGADEFTVGRPHPMVDSRSRFERILDEARDPQVAVLLLDFILGYNSSPDPVGELVPAIVQARKKAEGKGGSIIVAASVCGTEQDPQGLDRQNELLLEAGVRVFPSSAQAARYCAQLVNSLGEGKNG